jgi:hypothetical protein
VADPPDDPLTVTVDADRAAVRILTRLGPEVVRLLPSWNGCASRTPSSSAARTAVATWPQCAHRAESPGARTCSARGNPSNGTGQPGEHFL